MKRRLYLTWVMGAVFGLAFVPACSTGAARTPQGSSVSPTCLDQIDAQISARNASLTASYLKADPASGGIKTGILPYTQLLRAPTDQAILVVHGFMSSPFEVSPVAKALNTAGFNVLPVLLDGFGSSSQVANSRTYADWQKSYLWGVQTLGQCFSKISLLGFSLGGGLTLDYLLNPPPGQKGPDIEHAVLLSPYVIAASDSPFTLPDRTESVIQLLTADIAAKLLKCTEEISFSILDEVGKLTGMDHDLVIPQKYPGFYNTSFPIKAALQMALLTKNELLPAVSSKTSSVPTLLAFSEFDHTIDWKAGLKLIQTGFPTLQVISYDPSLKIPHQIDMPESGNDLPKLHAAIASFLVDAQSP